MTEKKEGRAFGMEGCMAHEQATADTPCWGSLEVFDEQDLPDGDLWQFSACEGRWPGMWSAGDPCDLTKYKRKPTP